MTKKLFFAAALLTLFAVACNNATNETVEKQKSVSPQSSQGEIIKDQYIIVLKESIIKHAVARLDNSKVYTRESKGAIMEKYNAEIATELDKWLAKNNIVASEVLQKYTAAMVGVAIKVNAEKYEAIRNSGDIESIEYDRIETLPPFQVENVERDGNAARAQTTPCGITNAGGAGVARAGSWIWIVDSGVDTDHPDLTVVTNTTYAKSFLAGNPSVEDCLGHGTHVAGICSAKNNTIGVVGVAAGANIVPVRVFGCGNSGSTSEIIAGVNHVATYDLAGDVCNMSLGGYYGTTGCSTGSAYKTAVTAVANGGTHISIASGNNNAPSSQYQPGCLNGTNIYTVTNMQCNKTYYNDPTYGGNYGSGVDWIATGTSVYSTYLNGGYATLTGTSMAAPTVAGIMQVRNGAPLQNGTVPFGGINYKIAVK